MNGSSMALLIAAGFVVSVVLIVVWIILPFAILGTKPLLRQLLAETRRTNELLARLPVVPPASGPARLLDDSPVMKGR